MNTQDPLDGSDQLATIDDLASWVTAHNISQVSKRPSRADLKKVHELRARLREVFEAGKEGKAVKILNELISETAARPELTNHDGEPWHMHYTPAGTPLAPRMAADAAMALSVVIAQEGYERLRVCEGDRCVDVFVDESKNHSRRYCSPNPCGNRASVAAFRARQRAAND